MDLVSEPASRSQPIAARAAPAMPASRRAGCWPRQPPHRQVQSLQCAEVRHFLAAGWSTRRQWYRQRLPPVHTVDGPRQRSRVARCCQRTNRPQSHQNKASACQRDALARTHAAGMVPTRQVTDACRRQARTSTRARSDTLPCQRVGREHCFGSPKCGESGGNGPRGRG
jgi:hypothetical protein